jgi:hypothetical protein
MSYDFALQQLCSHGVAFEYATYFNQTNTAKFVFPPSHLASVSVYIDGVNVPPSGLWSVVSLPFMTQGPYKIKSGVNDLIYLQIGSGTPFFVQLLTGNVEAQDLAVYLNKQVPSLNFIVINNIVVVQQQSSQSNKFKFIMVDPRWYDKTQSLPTTQRVLNTYDKLGIIPGRVSISKMILPRWVVQNDLSDASGVAKIVRFIDDLPNSAPVIQLCYTTTVNYCRRCNGTQLEFDYNILNGTYETVVNTDLLSQEFDKFMYTIKGSHWKWPWIGSNLLNRIGGKGATAQSTISGMLTMDVSQAFSIYQNVKIQQDRDFPFQQVTDAEFPLSLNGINVATYPDDPTVALITTTVTSRSTIPIQLNRIIGNPNPLMIGGNPSTFLPADQ